METAVVMDDALTRLVYTSLSEESERVVLIFDSLQHFVMMLGPVWSFGDKLNGSARSWDDSAPSGQVMDNFQVICRTN